MNSVKIGTYQMDTAFGLYLPEYTIPAPAPQTKFVKIIGRDGSVDLSDAIGLHYDSRSWSLDFKCFDPTVNWHTLTSSVMNAIHGKRLNFEFDDDPDYFWTGRISVSSYVSTRGTGTLKVNITSDPFKYAKLSTIVTKTASTGTEYTGSMVTFNDGLIYDLSADIEPIQDLHGYDSPWPAGGGKNKCVPDLANGQIGSNGGYSSNTSRLTNAVYVDNAYVSNTYLSAGTYTLSVDGLTQCTVLTKDASANIIDNFATAWHNLPYTFTMTAAGYVFFTVRKSSGDLNPDDYKAQIESGSTATSWTPYSNICPISGLTGLSVYVSPTQDQQDATTYSVDWTTQAGTVYGGTLDVVTGDLASKYGMVDLGTLTWTYNGIRFITYVPDIIARQDRRKGICSAYPVFNGSVAAAPDKSLIFSNSLSSDYSSIVYVKDSAYSDADDFKAAMSGVQLCYELATPLTYQLSAQEIEALVGTNNVWSSSGDVTVTVVTPETVTNNGLPAVPTVTASADMVLRWGNYSASVQQGTSTIPQLVLETGDNKICIIGAGNISFEWSEASL